MKRSTILLLTPLLLAGCVNQSTSYFIDGPSHSLTVRAEQEYFWNDALIVKMVAAHLPDCQRQFPMTTLPTADFQIELYGAGEHVYSLRVGKQVMRIETASCTRLPEPTAEELGDLLGTFKLDGEKKMVFVKAATVATPPAPQAN